ncbi:MAG: hypothetical protein A2W91_15900 [Bacteroidetes bacterium GWF2_38_335]|nr:MAG: hypothetical protein A2W91_15900 [Bacteroidetes bacterium GWF2_38_335]OFY81175.1 MAG: hypothetical protein A2281_06875 [Bacteroidetes bacterium RIFOXYA12_FULL_38_20]HBS85288.1 hypothetical protein [Bacteroidales bacterium]
MRIIILIAISFAFILACNNRDELKSETRTLMLMNEGIENSIRAIEESNESIYLDFEKQYLLSANRTAKMYELSMDIQTSFQETYSYISKIKKQLLIESDHDEAIVQLKNDFYIDYSKLNQEEQCPECTVILFQEGKAEKISERLEEHKMQVLKIIEKYQKCEERDDVRLAIKKLLSTKSENETWETDMFNEKSLLENIIILNKIQLDLRVAENTILKFLITFLNYYWQDFKKYETVVISTDYEINVGTEFKAEIYNMEVDSPSMFNYEIYVGDFEPYSFHLLGEEGKDWVKLENNKFNGGTFKKVFNKSGKQMIKGFFKYDTPKGPKYYPFEKEITVVPKK